MVNNSSLPETKGTVNGIGQSLVAILRSFGPTVGSLSFAWSEGNGELYLLHIQSYKMYLYLFRS